MAPDHSGGARRRGVPPAAGVLLSLLALSPPARSSDPAPPPVPAPVNAEENITDEPERRMVSWNEYEGRWFTARLGGGFLYDSANYSQDADSESQLALDMI